MASLRASKGWPAASGKVIGGPLGFDRFYIRWNNVGIRVEESTVAGNIPAKSVVWLIKSLPSKIFGLRLVSFVRGGLWWVSTKRR